MFGEMAAPLGETKEEERRWRRQQQRRQEKIDVEEVAIKRNLAKVEKERASFIQRRKTSGNQIHELRREPEVVVVDSPSSGSDCGSVLVGMNFV